MDELLGPWVCSVCGSDRIQPESIQRSLGDPKHPLGLCWECRGDKPLPSDKKATQIQLRPIKNQLSALCRPAEYAGKRRLPPTAPPEDLFGTLTDAERKSLERTLKW